MPDQRSSATYFYASHVFSAPFELGGPPASPFLVFTTVSLLLTYPMIVSPIAKEFGYPVFSSDIVLFVGASVGQSVSYNSFYTSTIEGPTTGGEVSELGFLCVVLL